MMGQVSHRHNVILVKNYIFLYGNLHTYYPWLEFGRWYTAILIIEANCHLRKFLSNLQPA